MLFRGFKQFIESVGVGHTVYIDSCCFNRQFDDQNSDRIRRETEAVNQVLDLVRAGQLRLIFSQALQEELLRHPEIAQKVRAIASEFVQRTPDIDWRGKKLAEDPLVRLGPYDALHVASAESAGADVLLTVDDKMIKKARRAHAHVRLENPVEWLRGTGFSRKAKALVSQV